MEILKQVENIGLVSLLEYQMKMIEVTGECSTLDTFSSGEDDSMSKKLRSCLTTDENLLTKTFLVINLTQDKEIDYFNHQIIAYYSLSSHFVINIQDKSQDFENFYDENPVTETKYPSIQIDNFARNHELDIDGNQGGVFGKGFGEVIFSFFVIPHLIKLSEYLGFKLITLFCADNGSGKLIKTYERYGFQKVDLEPDEECNILDYEHTPGNDNYTLMTKDFNSILEI